MATRYSILPSLEALKSTFSYDKEVGNFRCLKTHGNCKSQKEGAIADIKRASGYTLIRFQGKNYYAHRMAWYFENGELPNLPIDHINGVVNDNRICNLRLVPQSHNIQNQIRAQKGNRIGYLGVSEHGKNRYRATIQVGKSRTHIGTFDTPEEASLAYLEAKRLLHAGCTI